IRTKPRSSLPTSLVTASRLRTYVRPWVGFDRPQNSGQEATEEGREEASAFVARGAGEARPESREGSCCQGSEYESREEGNQEEGYEEGRPKGRASGE